MLGSRTSPSRLPRKGRAMWRRMVRDLESWADDGFCVKIVSSCIYVGCLWHPISLINEKVHSTWSAKPINSGNIVASDTSTSRWPACKGHKHVPIPIVGNMICLDIRAGERGRILYMRLR